MTRVGAWSRARAEHPPLLLMLDYDGTLSPIVPRPDAAELPARTRDAVSALAARADTRVAVISGRALADVRERVGIEGIVYAGNHGFEIEGPGFHTEQPEAAAAVPRLRACRDRLTERLRGVEGAIVEDKRLTLSVHYRMVAEPERELVRRAALEACGEDGLRATEGKRVVEIRPDVDWHKGRAARYLIDVLRLGAASPVLYIGDDTTDEDAFRALRGRGEGVLVAGAPPPDSAAGYYLRSTEEVVTLLDRLARDGTDGP